MAHVGAEKFTSALLKWEKDAQAYLGLVQDGFRDELQRTTLWTMARGKLLEHLNLTWSSYSSHEVLRTYLEDHLMLTVPSHSNPKGAAPMEINMAAVVYD